MKTAMSPKPEQNPPADDPTKPVDHWAAWYARECEEASVKPVVLPAPSTNPVLVPDLTSENTTEPNLANQAGGSPPPPIVAPD